MNWENFYLTCFFAGLLLTVVSFLFGAHFHLPVHVHFPNGFHLPHLSVHHGGGHGDSVSPLNLTTILMFVTWFGATGFLIAHYHSGGPALALMVSIAVGFAGGALMYLFTLRVFVANEHPLRDADFDMTGVLGRVSVPIRPSGT